MNFSKKFLGISYGFFDPNLRACNPKSCGTFDIRSVYIQMFPDILDYEGARLYYMLCFLCVLDGKN